MRLITWCGSVTPCTSNSCMCCAIFAAIRRKPVIVIGISFLPVWQGAQRRRLQRDRLVVRRTVDAPRAQAIFRHDTKTMTASPMMRKGTGCRWRPGQRRHAASRRLPTPVSPSHHGSSPDLSGFGSHRSTERDRTVPPACRCRAPQ